MTPARPPVPDPPRPHLLAHHLSVGVRASGCGEQAAGPTCPRVSCCQGLSCPGLRCCQVPWGLGDSASPSQNTPSPSQHSSQAWRLPPAYSGSAPPWTQKGSQGNLGAPWKPCPVLSLSPTSGTLTDSDSAFSRPSTDHTFSRPPRPGRPCCPKHEGMLASLWVGTGAPEPRRKDWRPQSRPIPGLSELQADIRPDFHTASTPSEISFPACGGSSRSTLKEYPSTPAKKPTAWDARHTPPHRTPGPPKGQRMAP